MTQLTQSQQDSIDQQQAGGAYNSSVSQATREGAINVQDAATLETVVSPTTTQSGTMGYPAADNVGDSQAAPQSPLLDNAEQQDDGMAPID